MNHIKLWVWNNIIERYFKDWLNDYANDYQYDNDNEYNNNELYYDLD